MMERNLLWIALALGGVSWLCSLLQTRARKSESGAKESVLPALTLLSAAALPMLVFLITLPSKAPFAEGQGFGRGFLAGGLLSLLAVWTIASARYGRSAESAARPAAEIAGSFGLAVVGASLPLLFMRATLMDALLGIGIGWFCVATLSFVGLFTVGLNELNEEGETLAEKRRSMAYVLVAGIGFAVTACVVAALGKYKGNIAPASGSGMMPWSSPALLLTAFVPLILLINALPAWVYGRVATKLPLWNLFARAFGRLFPGDEEKNAAGNGLRLALSALALIALTKLVTLKIIAQTAIFQVIVVGLVAAFLAWWMAAKRDEEDASSIVYHGLPPNALSVLVMLAGTIFAYQVLAGTGIALFTASAWLIGGVALAAALEPEENPSLPSPGGRGVGGEIAASGLLSALLFAVMIAVYRLYTSRYSDAMRGMTLTDQYALFSFVVGALAPFALAAFAMPSRALSAGSGLFRLVAAGALSLILPGVMLVLWGPKCALALLLGLAIATARVLGGGYWGVGNGSSRIQEKSTSQHPIPNTQYLTPFLTALFALAIALAMAQWTNHVLPHAEMTRDAKIGLLKWLTGSAVVLILLADYGSRLLGPRRVAGSTAKGEAK